MATQLEAKPDGGKETVLTFPVTGMTCAACQARVQRALSSEPGVVDASVNLLTNTAAVRYDPSAVTPERLIDAVRDTGYDAELPSTDDSVQLIAAATDQDAEAAAARALVIKAVASVVAGVVAMAFSMSAPAGPAINYLLLGLASVILLWAGHDIYRRAWTALRHQ